RWRWWWFLVPPALFVVWLFAIWPPPLWYRTHWPGETAFMRMRRAEGLLPRARGAGTRLYRPVALEEIAPVMAVAAMTGEDNNFWVHDGIDYLAILKALGYRRTDFEWSDPR